MATVYHTFNPYLPAIGRLLQVLESYGPIGSTLQICNRDLGRAAQCSPGRVPALLRTLEADGRIERVTSAQGSLIVVLGADLPIIDRSPESDQGIVDRSTPDSASERSTMFDPPTPPNRYKQHDQQQHGAQSQKNDWSNVTISGAQWIPVAALEKAGVTPEALLAADRKIATRCEYDRDTQVRTLFRSLLHNQPIYSAAEMTAQEPRHERYSRSVQPAHAPHRARRSAVPEPNEERDAEFRAQLAEFERAARARRASKVPGV